MRIGFDLDHVLYGHPDVFIPLVKALHAAGHELFCTSNHSTSEWERSDVSRLSKIGYDPAMLCPSMLAEETPTTGEDRYYRNKAPMADQLDLVFDDHARLIQPHTSTPVFQVPAVSRKKKNGLAHR